MTNKEFAEEVKRLTTPKYKLGELASKLGTSPQRIRYYTRIKSVIDPDEQCPFTFDGLEK